MIAGGWSILWNDLVDGATPGAARAFASTIVRAGRAAMTSTRTGRWFINGGMPIR
jgi:hypothetical protein